MPRPKKDEETLDDLLRGRLRIYQKVSGFRYSIDALLLAGFAGDAIREKPGRSLEALDLGSGTGVIPLVMSAYPQIAHITGLELVPELVAMSGRSVALNGLDDTIEIVAGDIRNPPSTLRRKSYDLVICNPPYRKKGVGRINPDRAKAIARHELAVNLEDILATTSKLIEPKGIACFIYGAFRATDILAGLRATRLEPKRLRFVHSRVDEPAKMVLIEAIESGPPECEVAAPLIVYKNKTDYSDEVERIFDGPQKT